jgi:hypothetical protein
VLVDEQDGQTARSSGTNAGGVAAKIDEGLVVGGDWMAIFIAWPREENGLAKTLCRSPD